ACWPAVAEGAGPAPHAASSSAGQAAARAARGARKWMFTGISWSLDRAGPAGANENDTRHGAFSGIAEEQHRVAVGEEPVALAHRVGVGRQHPLAAGKDRKSTRLNSSHVKISYAVFCLKK